MTRCSKGTLGETTTVEGLKVGPIRPRNGQGLRVTKNNRKSCKMQDLPVPQRSLTLPEPATREGSTRPTAPPTGPHRPP